MTQYIDKGALIIEIEKLIDEIYAGQPFDSLSREQQVALWYVKSIMSFIYTLEVKEVDLKLTWEDISKIRKILCGIVNYPLTSDEEVCTEVLKRFNAQKGE